jgi:hypothetical protein
MLCSQLSRTSGVGRDFLPAGFVPEGKLDSVPEPELVVDGAEVILDDVFCRSDGVRDFAVLKSLGDEFDDNPFPLAGYPVSVTLLFSEHNCLR